MEKIYEHTLLYDFYGELLTQHQRNVYEEAVFNDMSLGEIAEEYGISRQGVHDLIRRCDRILRDYEDKLHLVKKFMEAREKLRELEELAGGREGSLRDGEPGQEESSGEQEELSGEQEESSKGQKELSLEERMARIRELSRELLQEW